MAHAAAKQTEASMTTVLRPDGTRGDDLGPDVSDADLLSMHRWMVFSRVFDDKMMALQRTGRIAFYGEVRGQEASVVGTGWGLEARDWVFPALREGLILLMRGFPLERFIAANYGNDLDVMKGRQMPCHYASREYRQASWSSCMATQLPHATGAAYAARLKGDDAVFAGFVGDGGTSENDFHAALNFAGVHKTPNVFVVQNNQWAISVPTSKQTASASFAAKAKAYGFPGVRVDGNDVLAVYGAMKAAVDRARAGDGPTLIETVTFRMAGHSSSDDPTRYRPDALVEEWSRKDPIVRFEAYLRNEGLLDDEKALHVRDAAAGVIQEAVERVEEAAWWAPDTLFDDVYADVPPLLVGQRDEMRRMVADFGMPQGH